MNPPHLVLCLMKGYLHSHPTVPRSKLRLKEYSDSPKVTPWVDSRDGNPTETLPLKYPGPVSLSPGGRGLKGKVCLQTNSQSLTSSGGFQGRKQTPLACPQPHLMHPSSPKLTS